MDAELDLRTELRRADAASIATAAACLRDGGLVAFPTETVYGLGADATNEEAIARLFAAKGRPSFNPLIVHVPDVEQARRLAVFDAAAEALGAAFWPGALTLVLPKAQDCPVSELVTAGLDTIALRVPSHPVALSLLRATVKPIAAPSANRSGHVSPTLADHVLGDLAGRVALILDGGPTHVGLESTIVACLGAPRLLRPGGVPRDAIERVIRTAIESEDRAMPTDQDAPLAPGMLASHYAPRAQLRLNATRVEPGEALLAFGASPPEGFGQAAAVATLSERGDLVEAAARLFAQLRVLDASGAETIAVMPVPAHGLGEAINDRLMRAAAPRP